MFGNLFYVILSLPRKLSSLLLSHYGSGENLSVHPLEDICVTLRSDCATTVVCGLHVVVLLL